MKAPGWTPERLKKLSRKELEQLRTNALQRANEDLVSSCELELATRTQPAKTLTARSPKTTPTDVVVGYHFVCQSDRGVTTNSDGSFWSGSWVVAEINVKNSLKYGAYLALHNAKSELSYRQGKIVAYRKSTRSMIKKDEYGIEFKVEPEDQHYVWIGDGAGEKGYNWKPLSSKAVTPNQTAGE